MSKREVLGRYYDKLAPKLIKSLEARNYEAFYYQTKEEAKEKAMSLISPDDLVAWGGSMTLDEMAILEDIKKEYKVIDREKAENPQERLELMRESLLCDTYLTSVNAISENGTLIHIDGVGNRVAAFVFGPKQVIAIVGMNKVCKTEEQAIERAREFAAPLNVTRLDVEGTPCSITGSCGDCISENSVCTYIIKTRRCKFPGRIKVILVGESLGY